jgi:hypothetical protein
MRENFISKYSLPNQDKTHTKGMRKIFIQKLERKEQVCTDYESFNNLRIVEKLTRNWRIKENDIYLYQDTSLKNKFKFGNNFIGSFLSAYNLHGDILLNPDDIWLMISLYFSKYVDSNAQILRNKFVNHKGQKKLTVIEYTDSVGKSIQMEKQWDNFFNQIIEQIKNNTLPGVIDELKCDFSTTTPTHKLISTAIIMNSFERYFKYQRMIMECGIANVYFSGTRSDWIKVLDKTINLKKYDVDGKLVNYIDNLIVILNEFVKTWDNKPDINFWNRIMTTEERRIGSGYQKQIFIEGWILHFYGIYDRVDLDYVPSYSIKVPIELVNQLTRQTKDLELYADWVSISKVDNFTYKPDIGVCIVPKVNHPS